MWIVLVAALLAACTPAGAPTPTPSAPGTSTGNVELVVVAGPVCPVEREPPDPNCEPRPVAGARILVQPGDGADIVVGEATTNDEGRATIALPEGDYLLIGMEVEGLMGLPDPAPVVVTAGATVTVTLAYDTGIR